ncbi:RNA-directed DNA polymerase from mobile element jockey [Plakobranchus ocellatus]|uniref:RNA-directed DNA polymerase from mobile element jockey n=1 Tax=Plakobranchus ocellatus TaxID=259542 RepID=A0AAV4BZ69_9GAST|nr:RNA-directed DNA polymerase from mobile element jockey [Plakobranchus ocellatus]
MNISLAHLGHEECEIYEMHKKTATVSPSVTFQSKHLQHLERTIQLCINNVQKWVSENGFRFSVSKTTCVHFHRQRIYAEPALHLDGQPIPVKGEAKFLGVVFDSKLTFSSHVKYRKSA